MSISLKSIQERIPDRYEDILPVCPCGCEGVLAERWPDFETPLYVLDCQKRKILHDNSPLNIERAIIANKRYVREPLFHHMRHIRLLFPWITHDPNIVRLVRDTIECEKIGKHLFHMIGHASSGKTNFMVLDAFRMLDIFPRCSECFVASPYRSASEYLLWQAFNETADALKQYGNVAVFRRASTISYGVDRKAGPGTITLVSFHAVGVLRGKKLVDPDRGYLGVFLDEAGEFGNDSILHIIANLKSQRGLRVRTGTNFRSITGLDGRFNQPENLAWNQLSRELSYSWDSVGGARTVRLRAKVSPNMVLGEDYYTYLLRNNEHADLLAYGVDSPEYLAQGDAFPSIKSISRLILSNNDLQAGQIYEEVAFKAGTEEKFAFIDPSFTLHGDASILCAATLGQVADQSEYIQKIRIDDLHEIPVNEYSSWDDRLLDIALRLRGAKQLRESYVVGAQVTAFELNALLAGEYLLDHGIPLNNFGFDDSLRGQTTEAFVYFLGEGVESVFYGNVPTNKMSFPPQYKWGLKDARTKQRERQRMTCQEQYCNLASQMIMQTAAMIKASYVRNGFVAQRALDQIQLRLKAEPKSVAAQRKIAVESKDDYKARNRNHSPDHADALCGAVWMIVDRRLAPKEDAGQASMRGGVQVASKLLELAEAGFRRDKRVPTLSR